MKKFVNSSRYSTQRDTSPSPNSRTPRWTRITSGKAIKFELPPLPISKTLKLTLRVDNDTPERPAKAPALGEHLDPAISAETKRNTSDYDSDGVPRTPVLMKAICQQKERGNLRSLSGAPTVQDLFEEFESKFEHDAFRYDSPTESEVDGPADYEIVDGTKRRRTNITPELDRWKKHRCETGFRWVRKEIWVKQPVHRLTGEDI